ncbi:hypothetical protein OESDEN_11240 [Oesophagostomum dentatum]|uniref:Uncharacterized protein n=1 Tax=Oesophagostomum dentatum TaxID=61180 RepID=A0A0B1SVG0_OESDE|nr:hypothetical protein OESDEN_11240 [Oesophagostomum dentatum]
MVLWRAAGITYVRYSQIAAQITRKCSKSAQAMEAHLRGRRHGPSLKTVVWANGKPTNGDSQPNVGAKK